MKFQQRVPDWDDLIDFAVSDTWLDHYHALGMTWRHSRPPPDANQEHITRLLDKNAALEAEMEKFFFGEGSEKPPDFKAPEA
mgnify:CR=1 FL=1